MKFICYAVTAVLLASAARATDERSYHLWATEEAKLAKSKENNSLTDLSVNSSGNLESTTAEAKKIADALKAKETADALKAKGTADALNAQESADALKAQESADALKAKKFPKAIGTKAKKNGNNYVDDNLEAQADVTCTGDNLEWFRSNWVIVGGIALTVIFVGGGIYAFASIRNSHSDYL